MESPIPSVQYSSHDLGHLGLISGIFQDLGFVDMIDKLLLGNPTSRLSHGQTILAMVINGLGFTSRPMYLSPQFFANKPVDLLIGSDISSSDLNDYQFGKTLDALYAYGTSRLFEELGSKIFLQEGLGLRIGHYDTTSVSVYGQDYQAEDAQAVSITFGYSKDHRSDLRQFMIGLMVEPQYGVPWLFRALDGNTSDKTHFAEVIKTLQQEAQQGNEPMMLIADSALFTEEGLKEIDKVNYITRVPHSLKQAKALLSLYQRTDMQASQQAGYAYIELEEEIFGQQMRWLLVYSQAAYHRESKKLEATIEQQMSELGEALRKLRRKDFGCQEDAQQAVQQLLKKYKYLELDQAEMRAKNKSHTRGRPKAGAKLKQVWRISATCKPNEEAVDQKRSQIGKFILATNQLDKTEITSEMILASYKDQFQVEKGFRFLKSPMCMADALFLKKPERIEALTMIMCLALMVYALGERKLRTTLEEIDEFIPDQKGKPTQKPTLRWIFQCFEGITLLSIKQPNQPEIRQMLNLTPLHRQVIAIFGGETENIYTLAFSP